MYGLLGERLSHSFSPRIHNMLGDYEYRLFEVEPERLEAFIGEHNFDGINVTIPYKKAVMPYLDQISREALKIGSVNTVTVRNGRLYGDNTDYFGFLYMVRKSGIDVKNKKALVLGTGGASLTVIAVLRDLGAGEIINISRTGENNYGNISKHFDADIIVNTTPVGMYPQNLNCAVNIADFIKLQGVLDIVYNPLKTKLILDCEKRGIPCAGGLSMLVAQAVRANEIFFSRPLPKEISEKTEKKIKNQLQNIVLVGMAGCGKSTVGKILAKRLNKTFIDTDSMIEENENCPVPKIIGEKGEKYFRQCEIEAVKTAGMKNGCVIATGGGAVTREENLYPLLQNGIIIFINRDGEKLPTENRPISQKVGVKKLYEKRLPLYRSFAHIEIDGNSAAEETAEKAIKELEKYENSCN